MQRGFLFHYTRGKANSGLHLQADDDFEIGTFQKSELLSLYS